MRSVASFALLAAAAVAPCAQAEDLPFNPDRPGFADSTGVAPPMHVITEFGVTLAFPEKATALTAPDALVRVGLLDWLEARLVLPTYNRISPESGDALDGFGDLGIGAKAAFGAGPVALSAVATVTVPTGSDDFTADAVNGSLGLNFGVPLVAGLSLGGVVGASLVEDAAGDRALGTFGSLALGRGFGDFGPFVEVFGTRPDGGPMSTGLNIGAGYSVTPTGQIDATFTTGLGDDGPDNGINVGTSWLW